MTLFVGLGVSRHGFRAWMCDVTASPIPVRDDVSLIMTFYNERATVARFFDGLHTWTCLPAEVVMVDGGSTDDTVALVRERVETSPVPVRLFETGGCNISEGRNIAIREAQHDLIAITDMGCVVEPDWLEEILKPFDADSAMEVVGGYFEATGEHPVQRCYSDLLYKPVLTHQNFLPSSRSLALKRHVWEQVGGYPEDMTVAEDAEFDLRIRRAGFKETFAPDAKVSWNVKSRYRGYFYQYYRYARSAGYILQEPKKYGMIAAIYGGFLLWLFLGFVLHPAFFVLAIAHAGAYLGLRILRKERARKNLGLTTAPRYVMIVLATDLASVLGYLAGLPHFLLGRRETWKPPADR